MTVKITYPFTNSANYIYDNTKVDIFNGVAKLKDQRPSGATFYANYATNVKATWGFGTLTGTPFGGATIVGGKLDLAHDDTRYVDYDADLNADSTLTGCIRLLYTPNYTGAPPSPTGQKAILTITKENLSLNNLIFFYHSSAGPLKVAMYNNAASIIVDGDFGNFSAVSGIEYEFELNWDILNGQIRLFVDGTQYGSTLTNTGIRDSNIGLLRVGSNHLGTTTSNCYIRKLIIFNSVQHTSNYTPLQTIPDQIYLTDNPYVEPAAGFNLEDLEGFTETSTKTGSDEIKYNLKKGNNWYYWDGAAWSITSISDYTESSTANENDINKATFTNTGVTSKVRLFLHSDDGSTTPEIDTLEIDYNFYGGQPAPPDTCIVFGYCYDELNNPLPGVLITIALLPNKTVYNENIFISANNLTVTSDSNGYWDISLIESTTLDSKYVFTFSYDGKTRTYIKIVPNEVSKNFAKLENA